jgi:hypothetical protein
VIVDDEKVMRVENILIITPGCDVDLTPRVNHETSIKTASPAGKAEVPRLLI